MTEKVCGTKPQANQWYHRALRAVVSLLVLVSMLPSCAAYRPIRIGFTGELSGRNATLGVQSRNGAAMAVEEINANGGIAGRPIEMVVRDNQGNPERVPELDQELIDSGIFVLTGHNTSWESVAAKPVIDARQAVLVSPSATTPLFDNRDDYFFRLLPNNSAQAQPLASYAYKGLNIRRMVLLDDDDNSSFAHPYGEAFLERFTSLGGEKAAELHFSSKSQPDFQSLVQKLRASNADGLLVIASDTDTALVAQQARLADWNVQILATNWAYTSNLIKNGGRAVNGIILPSHFNTSCVESGYQHFREKYRASYGEEPAFVAALSYETIHVIARALTASGGKWEGLADELTRVRDFDGLCGKISMNENGDAQRDLYLVQIRDSQYMILQTLAPEDAP